MGWYTGAKGAGCTSLLVSGNQPKLKQPVRFSSRYPVSISFLLSIFSLQNHQIHIWFWEISEPPPPKKNKKTWLAQNVYWILFAFFFSFWNMYTTDSDTCGLASTSCGFTSSDCRESHSCWRGYIYHGEYGQWDSCWCLLISSLIPSTQPSLKSNSRRSNMLWLGWKI